MLNYFFAGLGGFIGATLRYAIFSLPLFKTTEYPIATLAINIVGSFVMGVFSVLVENGIAGNNTSVFVLTGICGGFTTLSAFSLETLSFYSSGHYFIATTYAIITFSSSVLALAFGRFIINLLLAN